MRVLVTVTGSTSHVNAVLPLVSALAAARHRVLIAAPPRLLGPLTDLPVDLAPVLPDPLDHRPPADRPDLEQVLARFAGPHLNEGYQALLPPARAFAPDLVLRDGGEFTGHLVAEALGVPQLAAPSGVANHLAPATLLPALNRRRADLGLPAEPDPAALHRYGRLDCMPAEYSFTGWAGPTTVLRYQQPATVRPGAALPAWLAELPTEQPLVLATIGTVLPIGVFDATGLLETIVAGLAELDCHSVVATGGVPVDPALASERVHLVDAVDQSLVLRCAQLLVTHGGYNSVREAVGAGVPMAVLPCFGDQPANADRVQELGLGRRLPTPASPADLAAACRALLADPATAARARAAQRRMLALPPVDALLGRLEKLVREAS
ncbi:glycosyltransferase [Kitasatospora sp. LaBMicrA B282]|uniref:glycosyltransferase n=1 Tax=Kitasatospora sp. LaBMicrA B282 TaxID=3420949 RepID=UPI003D0B5A84